MSAMKNVRLTVLVAALSWLCFQRASAEPAQPSQAHEAQNEAADPKTAPQDIEGASHDPAMATGAEARPASAAQNEAPSEKRPNASERAAKEGRAFIAHVPVGSVEASQARLPFEVRGEDLAFAIVVYFKPIDAQSAPFQSVIAARDERGYAAIIPTSLARAPGVVYYAVERLPNGQERPIFASRDKPHPLQIYYDSETAREERLLALSGGHRSRVNARAEWVDLGGFDVDGTSAAADERDRYYHIEAQYAYRFFRTVEELEFALGYLRGDVLDQRDITQRRELGLNYGRAALTLAWGDFFRFRPGLVLGVSERGFEGGFDAAMIIGQRDGTAFQLKGGYTSHVGGSFGAHLGWATVPRVPMGALVEITNFPTNDEAGVRMLFDIGYEVSNATLVRLWAGYRGRTSLAGGPALGVETMVSF